ncbi:MAG: hypothetical protein C0614_00180 [Desulfuromonas sp.]|nr:MAG: hypothetical protein C0614_00180 [Desulfuromonas sp.]
MVKPITHCLTLLFLLCLLVATADAAWLIFDVAGEVKLTHNTKVVNLTMKKHLLKEVAAGDSLEAGGDGRVVLVSMASNDAFEIGGPAIINVGETALKAIKGTFDKRKGYALPKTKSNLMAGVVMRGDADNPCLEILAGHNTAVNTLTPTLKWYNGCDKGPLHFSLFADAGLLLEHETQFPETKVPEGLLHYGERYVWLIETPEGDNLAAASFTTLDEIQTGEVNRRLKQASTGQRDLAVRLSDLFFLRQNHLNDLADQEQASLGRDYPDVDFSARLEQ